MDPNRPSTVVVTGASGGIGRAVAQADGHDFGAHGTVDDTAHGRAPQLWASHHHNVMAAAVGAASLAAALWARWAKA
jgi:NAD(P)-dependent dehydrogenase (short-subunit alcohol dehydrogenase family)